MYHQSRWLRSLQALIPGPMCDGGQRIADGGASQLTFRRHVVMGFAEVVDFDLAAPLCCDVTPCSGSRQDDRGRDSLTVSHGAAPSGRA